MDEKILGVEDKVEEMDNSVKKKVLNLKTFRHKTSRKSGTL